MSRIMVGALIAAVALAGTIYWELRSSREPGIATVTSGRSPLIGNVRSAPGLATVDAVQGWVSSMLGRPLFREDRRPPKTGNDVVLKGDEPTRLTGVITGPFGNRAIFMSGGNPQPIVATEGTRVSDFVVRSIQPDRVIIESDGGVRTLKPTFVEDAKPPRR
jgi:hypothetical protein